MKKWMWPSVLVCLIVLVVVLGTAGRSDVERYKGAALQAALDASPDTVPANLKDLEHLILFDYREYSANATRWSAAYFGCNVGSAFFSALAGFVLNLKSLARRPVLKNDLATSLATIAALLVTLSTGANFQRKWEANRVAANATENLAYELLRSGKVADRNAVLNSIEEIKEAFNGGMIGEVKRGPRIAARTRQGDTSEVSPSPQSKPSGSRGRSEDNQ